MKARDRALQAQSLAFMRGTFKHIRWSDSAVKTYWRRIVLADRISVNLMKALRQNTLTVQIECPIFI
jgi:hypothetical protein